MTIAIGYGIGILLAFLVVPMFARAMEDNADEQHSIRIIMPFIWPVALFMVLIYLVLIVTALIDDCLMHFLKAKTDK